MDLYQSENYCNYNNNEETTAKTIVNKILETLPKYSLREFIYLLSVTISDERNGRLDTLSRALELVDNETRLDIVRLFKQNGIDDKVITELMNQLSVNVNSSHINHSYPKERYNPLRKSWPLNKSNENDMLSYEHHYNPLYNNSSKTQMYKSTVIDDYQWPPTNKRACYNSEPRWTLHDSCKEEPIYDDFQTYSDGVNHCQIIQDIYLPDYRTRHIKDEKPFDHIGKYNKKCSKKTRFSKEESLFIVSLVESNDITNWTAIAKACNAKFGGNKTGPQCHQHYFRVANSSISKNPWRKEEDEMLKKLVEKYGFKWSQISQSLPGRPDTSCRRRWKAIQKNKNA